MARIAFSFRVPWLFDDNSWRPLPFGWSRFHGRLCRHLRGLLRVGCSCCFRARSRTPGTRFPTQYSHVARPPRLPCVLRMLRKRINTLLDEYPRTRGRLPSRPTFEKSWSPKLGHPGFSPVLEESPKRSGLLVMCSLSGYPFWEYW